MPAQPDGLTAGGPHPVVNHSAFGVGQVRTLVAEGVSVFLSRPSSVLDPCLDTPS